MKSSCSLFIEVFVQYHLSSQEKVGEEDFRVPAREDVSFWLTVLYRPWLITIIIIKRKPRCCQNEIAIIFLKPKVSLHCDELGSYEQLQCDNGNCWCVQEQTGGIIVVIKFVMDVITTTKINHSELLSQLYCCDVLQIQEKLFQLLSLKLSSSSYPASTIKTK